VVFRNRFYPTPSTTQYYIGGILIDDVYRVDFQRRVNRQPIYGYDDRLYGFVAEGKELVSGNIIINYRYPGYLKNVVLRSIADTQASKDFISKNLGEERGLVSQESIDLTIKEMEEVLTVAEKMEILANRLIEAGALTNQQLVDRLKRTFEDRFAQGPDPDAVRAFGSLESPVSEGVAMFDLTVKYGFQKAETTYTRVFKDVVLVGESQTVSAAAGAGGDFSSSAQNLLEIYPFFAKTIIVDNPKDR